MGLLSDFRDGSFLRRMVAALESIADSQRTLAEAAIADRTTPVLEPKPMTVGSFDADAANAQYRQRVMEEHGMATIEEYEEWRDARRH